MLGERLGVLHTGDELVVRRLLCRALCLSHPGLGLRLSLASLGRRSERLSLRLVGLIPCRFGLGLRGRSFLLLLRELGLGRSGLGLLLLRIDLVLDCLHVLLFLANRSTGRSGPLGQTRRPGLRSCP